MKTIRKKINLEKLESYRQSVWLDYIRRDIIQNGQLKNLIEQYGIRGVTSNPAIFEKAIDDSNVYDEDIDRLIKQGKNAQEIYEILTVRDIQEAADNFRPLYDSTGGQDGFVSLEVSPHLAHETEGTIREARELWKRVNKPNVLIKIPATIEGFPAIRQCNQCQCHTDFRSANLYESGDSLYRRPGITRSAGQTNQPDCIRGQLLSQPYRCFGG